MKELVKRVLAGDRDAYRDVVKEYGPVVRACLASHLTSAQTVEDLAQETFIAAYEHLKEFDVQRDFGPWIKTIARNKALAVHHVTVQDIGGRLSVSLDLELDGKLSLAQAHEVADGLEESIAAELGPEVEVETHIEPLQPGRTRGREAPPERIRAVEIALAEIAAPVPRLHRVALHQRVLAEPGITAVLKKEEIERAFSLDEALRHVDAIFERTLALEGEK